jgi:hypothetical protein
MFLEVFANQGIAAGSTIYSQAFEIGDDNALFLAVMAATGTSGTNTLTVTGEGSNDLTNWFGTAVTGNLVINTTSPASNSVNLTAIAARYVRLKVYGSGSTGITFSATVNSKQL